MTKQEFETVKTIIYACSNPVWSNGIRVPYADTDRVISALEKIFAEELGVRREEPLWRIWKDQDDEKREVEAAQKEEAVAQETDKDSAATFLMKLLGRSK